MTTHTLHTARRLAGTFVALTLTCGLAACAQDDSDFDYSASFTPKPNAEVSEVAEEQTTERTTEPEYSEPEPTRSQQRETSRQCGVDKEADEIYNNVSKVPDDSSGIPWFYNGYSNYDPCVDLSFAVVDHRPTASRFQSRQIMLFHQGEYLGVGSDQLTVHVDIVNITNDSITVKYMNPDGVARSPQEDYDNALDVTYRWDGEKVQMLGYNG